MIYLNDKFFKPALLVLSAIFGLATLIFLLLMIFSFHWLLLVILAVLLGAYGVLVWLAYMVSKSKKRFLRVREGNLEVKYPTVNYGRGVVRIPLQSIIEFEFYGLQSTETWKKFFECGAPPDCFYVKYYNKYDREVCELIGYPDFDQMLGLADGYGIPLMLM